MLAVATGTGAKTPRGARATYSRQLTDNMYTTTHTHVRTRYVRVGSTYLLLLQS